MPAQDRLWLDDKQRILPGLEVAGQQDEERAIRACEARPLDRAVEHDQLLTKQQVFCDQLWFAASEVGDGAENRVMREGLGQARDGRADTSQPSFDDRRHGPQDLEHHLPPSYRLETAHRSEMKQ